MKKVKTKIVTLFVLLMIIMMSMMANSVLAVGPYKEERELERAAASVSNNDLVSGNRVISFGDLRDKWYIFCREKGVHIPSHSSGNAYYYDFVDGQEENPNFLNTDPKRISHPDGDCSAHAEIISHDYTEESAAKYSSAKYGICRPKEAYILTYSDQNTGTYPSPVQQAWWNTDAGSEGASYTATGAGSELLRAANEYHKFVKKLADKGGGNVENTATYTRKTHTFSNGDKVSIRFPNINIDDTVTFKKDKAKVRLNKETNRYLLGPYKINYVKGSVDGAYGNEFGFINRFNIFTDANGGSALADDEWNFYYPNRTNNGSHYPDPGEEFYIEMDYIEDATKIIRMEVDYKYLIAGGRYQKIDGKYNSAEYKWETKKEPQRDEDGNVTHIQVTHEINKTPNPTQDSQKLIVVQQAARWYETKTIELLYAHKGSLKIEKKAVDENGKELTSKEVAEMFNGKEQYFDFKVKIDGVEQKVTVEAGDSITIPYTWATDEAPTYEVAEIINGLEPEWKFVSIQNEKGSLEDNKTVTVTAVNKSMTSHKRNNTCF